MPITTAYTVWPEKPATVELVRIKGNRLLRINPLGFLAFSLNFILRFATEYEHGCLESVLTSQKLDKCTSSGVTNLKNKPIFFMKNRPLAPSYDAVSYLWVLYVCYKLGLL